VNETKLPSLNDIHPLCEDQIAEFRTRGHTCVRALASPEEMRRFGPTLERLALERSRERRSLEERDVYGRAFLQIQNLWLYDRTVQAFVFARRFAQLAARLLGVDGVRLYHDQALFKEPGGGFTPWHQDQFYWPLATDHTITLWMPLVDVELDMGPMYFASGSQRLGDLGDLPIGDESEQAFARLVGEHGLSLKTHGPFRAGDATFHAGRTLHRAPANQTDRMRAAMTVIYFADGTRVDALDHPNRRLDQVAWLPGCNEGDLAASVLNPLLHPRETSGLIDPPQLGREHWQAVVDAARRI
jgi:hypothetical protein